jgi:hypothetical protein
MKLTAPWHRKTPSQVHEPPPLLASSLDAISAQLDGLARKVDRLDRVQAPVRPAVQDAPDEALETAISGLRSIVAHVASADALATLGSDLQALTGQVNGEPKPLATTPTLGDFEHRIGSIADAIAALRAENQRRTLRNLASLVEILTEKIEVLQVQQSNAPVALPVAKPAHPSAEKRPNNLAAIERGIADLMHEVKEVRAHTVRCASERTRAPACEVERNLAELQQTQSVATRRTQDSLAAVHGTIDDLFERMASLESDIRAREAAKRAAPLPEPAPQRAPAPDPVPSPLSAPTLVPDAAPLPEPGPGMAAPDLPGFARLREPGRPFRPAAAAIAASSPAPTVGSRAQRRDELRGVLLKAAVGIGLAAALVGALLFFVPYLTTHASFEAPPVQTAVREPRSDDAWHGSSDNAAPIEKLLGDLPSSIGARLFKSAASGDPNAAYEIGLRLTAGGDSAGTGDQAVLWLERAASAGLTPALLVLGSVYEKGVGVAKDPLRARTYYLAAAGRGSAKAMHNLAVLYANGASGKVDQAAAADWFRKAAMRGVIDSQFNLAVLYERGAGVEQNTAEAYKWFALAAHQGDAGAARKRDEVAKKLDDSSLKAMNAAVEAIVAAQQAEDPPKPLPANSEEVPADPPPKRKAQPSFPRGVAALADAFASRTR